MRILQVHTHYRQPGGEDSVVRAEGNLLRAAGHDVLLHRIDNPLSTQEAAQALLSAPWNGAAAKAVVAKAHQFAADVVHVHNTWFALSPAVFKLVREAGFPIVATMHNYRLSCVNALLYRNGSICQDCVGHMPWRGVTHRCYRGSTVQSTLAAVTIGTHRVMGTWENVNVVIALTSFAAEKLITAGVPADRIVVKPNVTEDPGRRIRPASKSNQLLFVGRMTEEKGVTDLLDAWHTAGDVGLELKIVGDGPLLSEVQLSARPTVSVIGPLSPDEVRRCMLTARALVLPSRWFEGFPMVLIEALSSGLPVLVPDHGALPEIVGEGGLNFISGDTKDLARALFELRDDALIDQKSAAANQMFLSKYRPSIGVTKLEEIYQLAMEGVMTRGRTP